MLLVLITFVFVTSIFLLDKASIDNTFYYAISNLFLLTNVFSGYDINYFTSNRIYKPLSHLGSLPIEWQSYLVFSI